MRQLNRKRKASVVFMVVLAMLVQMIAPMASQIAYAVEEGKDDIFQIIDIDIVDGLATVNWKYEFASNGKTEFELDVDFNLIEDEVQSGELESKEGIIGQYSITKDGKLTVNIIKEAIEKLLEEPEDETSIPLIPLEPSNPIESETDDEETIPLIPLVPAEPVESEDKDFSRIKENLSGMFSRNIVYADGHNDKVKAYTFTGNIKVEGVIEKNDFEIGTQSSEDGDLGNIFTGVKLTLGDKEIQDGDIIEITDGTEVRVDLEWKLDDSIDLNEGDWSQIKLPSQMANIRDGGDLLDSDGTTVVGSYAFEDGYLKVTFNNKLNELDKTENRHGTVGFLMKFELSEFENDTRQTIKFEGISKEIKITGKPSGEDIKEIAKSGKPDADINPKNINWVIDVNTTLDDLKNAKVIDIIPAGLELNEDSIKVYELTVGINGKLTEGSHRDDLTGVATDEGFEVELGDTNKAYRIKYSTKIVGYPEEGYNNKAILSADDKDHKEAEFKIDKIERGSLIEKSGWADKDTNAEKVTWQIDINKAEENLSNVSVEDTIPAGLTINNIKIYELNKSESSWNQEKEVSEDFNDLSNFPISFGDINGKAYRIIVETNIVYGDEYKQSIDFDNTASLKEGNTSVDSDNAKVTVNRGTLLEKSGKETTSYGNPEITWTIQVNKANHEIDNATITDRMSEGLRLRQGSIKVDGNTVPVGGSDHPRLEKQEDREFILKLGDINRSYEVTYITDITDPSKTSFVNEVGLSGEGLYGDGIGEGGIITKTPSVKPSVNNKYDKGRAANKTIDVIRYWNSPNYEEKTMSWVITVDAIKEKITELKITDTFDPAGSMVFLENSLRVIVDGDTTQPLTAGTGYTLTPKDKDGFELEFIGDHKPLKRAKYEIYFKTSFDPNKVLAAGGNLNTTKVYKNKAIFEGKIEDVNGKPGDINTNAKANYSIDQTIFDGGKKDGSLDREKRTITWKIYANALGRDLTGEEFKIVDILSEGQKFVEGSLKVYEFSLSKDGKITEGEEITTGFVLTPNVDGSEFALSFANGVDIPVMVQFQSKIEGISKEKYENTAKTYRGEQLDKTYKGEVKYSNYNKFVDKNSDLEGNSAYTDDEIQWTVTVNESLSEIDNAIFKDTISAGQILVNNSIRVDGEETDADKLTIDTKEDGTTELEIKLGKIHSVYTITYTTVVTATEGKISNSASLWGDEEQLGSSSEKEYSSSQASWGTGTGTRPRGQIQITKKDAETKEIIANNPAKFELYYMLNGEERIVNGEAVSTENGLIIYGNLPYRTYYLREVEAPEGYQLNDKGDIIIVDGENKDVKLDIENTKIKINVKATKEWINGPKPTIWFKLYRQIGENGVKEEVEKAEVKKLESGTTTVTWEGLEKTDIDGKEYIYSVEEVDENGNAFIPENYEINESENPLIVINKYTSPLINVTGKKEWVHGESLGKPTIKLQLYRNGEALTDKIITLEHPETEYTWKNLDKTDENGVDYEYTVDEVEVPENYGKTRSDDKLTVINTYGSPTTTITGRKVWVNGNFNRPSSIQLQLFRNIKDEDKEEVGEPVTLKKGTHEYNWEEQPITDESGREYIYTVQEVGTPDNYVKSEEGLTVTNKYVIPKTEITGTKEWVGGPKTKPEIELQLFRDGKEYGNPVKLKDGVTNYTWKDLDETDENGVPYKYTVDEVKVPAYYRKEIDGLTVRNIYNPPIDPEEPSPLQGRIRIIKKDSDSNELLKGAEFEIVNRANGVVGTLRTNEQGVAVSNYLPVGKYIIKEIKAPEGYLLSTDTIEVSIHDGVTIDLSIFNDIDPEEPEEPTEPEDPEEPEEPTEPEDPEDPTVEGEDEDTPGGGIDRDPKDPEDPKKPTLPKSGSATNLYVIGLGILMLVAGFVLRKRIIE